VIAMGAADKEALHFGGLLVALCLPTAASMLSAMPLSAATWGQGAGGAPGLWCHSEPVVPSG